MSLLNALPCASFAAALHALHAFKVVWLFLLCSAIPCGCHILSTLLWGQWRKHHNITDISLDVSSVLPEGIQLLPNNTHSISSACFFYPIGGSFRMHCGSTLDCTHWGRKYSLFWKCLCLYACSWMHACAHSQHLSEKILLQKVMQVIDLLWNCLRLKRNVLILKCCFADVFVYFDIDYCIRSSNNPINRRCPKVHERDAELLFCLQSPFLTGKVIKYSKCWHLPV